MPLRREDRQVRAGPERRHGRGGAEVGDDVLVLVLVLEAGGAEAVRELGHLVVVVAAVQDVAGGVGSHGLGGLDLRDGQRAALGDVGGGALGGRRGRLGGPGRLGGAGVAGRGLGGRRRGRLGNVKDVQGAAGGGLDGRGLGGVVSAVVAVDDVVVPVALAALESAAGEAEGALPRAGLGRGLVLGQGELVVVVVPGAEEVDGLDARRNAERKGELSRHFDGNCY
jgi:hypothetical protein